MQSRLSVTSQSKQTTIFSAFQKWKSLEKKQQIMKYQMKTKCITPVLIDLSQLDTDSDSDMETTAGTRLANDCSQIVKLEYSEMIGVNIPNKPLSKPNASSTPLKLQNLMQNSFLSDEESSQSTVILEESEGSLEDTINLEDYVGKVIFDETLSRTSSEDIKNSKPSLVPYASNITEMVVARQSGGYKMNPEPLDKNRKLQENENKALDKSPTLTHKSPTKRKADDVPNEEISEKSPKRESKRMNNNYLIVMNDLFENVHNSPYLRTLVEAEKPVLNMMVTADPKYFFVCLKLCTWLPKWYNIFKFCEKIMVGLEENEIINLYKFLKHNEIVDINICEQDLLTLLNDLSKVQLKSICDKFKMLKTLTSKSTMRKEDIIQSLLKYCNTQSTLLKKTAKDLLMEEVERQMEYCVKLNDSFRETFYNAYILGTFTNPAFDDIRDFFNNMLNFRTVFPEYKVEDHMVFSSKDEFKSYVEARKLRECIEDNMQSKNHLELLQQSKKAFQALKELINTNVNKNQDQERYKAVPHLRKFTAQEVYISCLSMVTESLTTKYPDEVRQWLEYLIEHFPSSTRLGDWYYQLTWLYMRYLQPNDNEHAAKLIIEVLRSDRDNLSDVQLQQIGRRSEKLKASRKSKIKQLDHDTIAELVPETIKLETFPATTVDATAIRSTDKGRKRNYVVHDTDGNKRYMSVENIALEYYIEKCGYSDGTHCEGSLIKATFTLFFWDIIYNPDKVVPGTFLSKIQNVPLDMYSTHFYGNRKHAIDRRLKEIESDWPDEELLRFVKRSWELHSHEHGYCEPGLIIKNSEFLDILVNCIGRKILAKIYERLVKNLRLYSSGLPDLLVWNIDNKKSKFVEVKGENDKLSIKQTLWLNYLISIGANTEVCHVHSMGSKRMKLKSSEENGKQAKLSEKEVEGEENKGDNEKRKSPRKKPKLSEKKVKVEENKVDNEERKLAKKKERKAKVGNGKRKQKEKNEKLDDQSQKSDVSEFCETVLECHLDERASTSSSETKKENAKMNKKTQNKSTSACSSNASHLDEVSGIIHENSDSVPD
ncbi:unnamed protein product [Phaedon cochleariae]|uniref:Fanconi-associated nuclease n=1 Tax=Phaedon cochleariae TaxID=80249 RepID=A0A9N9SDQ4_PHACE|nr:unnamed protein product [Phaedon cochleariae]